MTSDDTDLICTRDRDVLTLTLNRAAKANSLAPALVEDLIAALDQADDVRMAIIQGEGKHFCAGFDLSDIAELSDGDLLWRFVRIELLLQKIHLSPFPVIALAHGQIVGAGADLFAACWRRVVAPGSKLKMPGWNFELALGTGRLAALIGQDAARDLLIDTRSISAEQAVEIGLASDLVGKEDWSALASDLAKRAGALPTEATSRMMGLTRSDRTEQDLAALVRSAARPGLKARIESYRSRVMRSQKRAPAN
ncbi:putative enoyl-CoA hydratase echA6 [Tritonibacter multivorans]|uniref:Putative enoyl-CoA hydratase echA6 n=1 Tax=Tritonibacter multivorans TaxID=928856 RepID=A0A0P1G9X0_9RHOB|nr:enoyl-CoA hydratase/isomerase family protein [Tritonibacter multivorans]MDA7422876.1 enoyl-CoA hydratase/isomerase family protein [Tritonibacter multivorans]CUH78232.1 putative enoyl-CoA hydratase echA6 [Tritonibacter multivorans]SFD62758.1 Enoyl-CoA hydratase/carnithine racemase [Tritonibacter multivorans]